MDRFVTYHAPIAGPRSALVIRPAVLEFLLLAVSP